MTELYRSICESHLKNSGTGDAWKVASRFNLEMVGPGRVELPTSRLSGVRSNHLSYEPFAYCKEACL